MVQDLVAADDVASPVDEQAQKRALFVRQRMDLAIHLRFKAREADVRLADPDRLSGLAQAAAQVLSALETIAHPEQKLLEVERFDDVILRAQLQAADAILGRAERGEKNDRGARLGLSQHRGDIKARTIRQAHVHQSQTEFALADLEPRLLGGRRPGDIKAFLLQALDQGRADVLFVLDDENSWTLNHGNPRIPARS